jgi:lysophospholipid acyltransferase 5
MIFEARKDIADFASQPGVRHVLWVLRKLYTVVFMGYCLVPFVLLNYTKWIAAYSAVYWIGHIFFLPWFFCGHMVVRALRPKRALKEE